MLKVNISFTLCSTTKRSICPNHCWKLLLRKQLLNGLYDLKLTDGYQSIFHFKFQKKRFKTQGEYIEIPWLYFDLSCVRLVRAMTVYNTVTSETIFTLLSAYRLLVMFPRNHGYIIIHHVLKDGTHHGACSRNRIIVLQWFLLADFLIFLLHHRIKLIIRDAGASSGSKFIIATSVSGASSVV